MLKLVSSTTDSTPISNAHVAEQIADAFKDDAYFAEVGLLKENIHTLGFMRQARGNLEMFETVDLVT